MSYSFTALLPDRGLIELKGPDAEKFLQGLVTNDLSHARPGDAVFAGLLTPKGKIQFDFLIFQQGDDIYWIDCPLDQADALAKRLTIYKLRAQVDIVDRSGDFVIGAAWGDEEKHARSGWLASYRDPRYVPLGDRFVAPREGGDQGAHAPAAETLGDTAYHSHRIALAVPQGGLDYAYGEAFPHEVCYDELHGVDFKKGCYVGQEVVSRMHHKGTAKTRVAAVEASAPFEGGGVEIQVGEMPVGQLGSVDGTHGVAILRLDRVADAVKQGRPLTVGSVTLTVRRPPWASYEVPSEGADF